jgi:hypothetical protein
MTTQLFSQTTGAQYLSATIGQIRYFTLPRVTLPDQITQTLPGQTLATLPGQQTSVILPGQNLPTLPGQTLATVPGETPQTYRASDIIGEVSVTAYKNWSVNLDYQWNPYTSQTDKSEILVQYRPDPSKAIRRLLCLADCRPLEHRRALGLLAPGPANHRTAGGIRVQELLLEDPGVAAPLRDEPYGGTQHLDCITIGTDGPKLGRKACGCLLIEGNQRIFDTRPRRPVGFTEKVTDLCINQRLFAAS